MNKNLFLILTTVATLCGCSDDRVNSLEPSQSGSETNGYTMSFSISAEDYDDPDGILASQTRSGYAGTLTPKNAEDILEDGFLLSAYTEYDEAIFENYFCCVEDGKWLFFDSNNFTFDGSYLANKGDTQLAPQWPTDNDGDVTFYAAYIGSPGKEDKMVRNEESGQLRLSFDNSLTFANSPSDFMVCSYIGSRASGSIKLNFKHIVSMFKVKAQAKSVTQDVQMIQYLMSVPRYVDYNFTDDCLALSLDDMGEGIETRCSAVIDGEEPYVLPDAATQVTLTEAGWSSDDINYNYWGVLLPENSKMSLSLAYKVGESDFVNYRSTTIKPAAGVMTYFPISLFVPTNEAVDLGLTSGTKWASCNVGAATPSQAGAYFAWGEVWPFGFSDGDNSNVSSFNKATGDALSEYDSEMGDGYLSAYQYPGYNAYNGTHIKGYYCQGTYKYVDESHDLSKYTNDDHLTTLESDDDAASVNMGGSWRMPTEAEWGELLACTWELTTLNDVSGYQVTGPNGNSIFLPLAGTVDGGDVKDTGSSAYYWTSELIEEGSSDVNVVELTSTVQSSWSLVRYSYACPVRAVMSSSTPSTE